MNESDMTSLAEEFKTAVQAALDEASVTAVAKLADNLEEAERAWSAAASSLQALEQLGFDVREDKSSTEFAQDTDFEQLKGVLNNVANFAALASLPASLLAEPKGLDRARKILEQRWFKCRAEELGVLIQYEAVALLVNDVAPYRQELAAQKKKLQATLPRRKDVLVIEKWRKSRDALRERIDNVLPAGASAFLSAAALDGAWLDQLDRTTLDWLKEHNLARHLKVSYSQQPNPHPVHAEEANDDGGWD